MEKETRSPSNTRSNWWIWLIVAIILLCLALVCCGLVAGGIYYLWPDSSNQVVVPRPQAIPTAFPMPTGIPIGPVEPVTGFLDPEADPLYGSVSLQRGFSPDPYAVGIQAGGTAYASANNFPCGFTTSEPTFKFSLGGGASETFLRIFFAASENANPTLVLLTPDQEWLCADDSPGGGLDPVIDLEFAASGNYVLWVGTWTYDTSIHGNLFITGSENNTP